MHCRWQSLPQFDRQGDASLDAISYAAQVRGYDLELRDPEPGTSDGGSDARKKAEQVRKWCVNENQALLLEAGPLDLHVVADRDRPLLHAFAELRGSGSGAARIAAFWDRFAARHRHAAEALDLLRRAGGDRAAASLALLESGTVPVALDLDGTLVASGDGPAPPGAAPRRFNGGRWLRVRPGAVALLRRLRRSGYVQKGGGSMGQGGKEEPRIVGGRASTARARERDRRERGRKRGRGRGRRDREREDGGGRWRGLGRLS